MSNTSDLTGTSLMRNVSSESSGKSILVIGLYTRLLKNRFDH